MGKDSAMTLIENLDASSIAYKFLMQPFLWFGLGLFCLVLGYFLQAVGNKKIENGRHGLGRGIWWSGTFAALGAPLVFIGGWWGGWLL